MDKEVIEALRKSKAAFRWLYPVLRAKDGSVVDGDHRLAADPSWKSITIAEVDSEEKKALARIACNFVRREVSAEEKSEMLGALARLGWGVKKIAEETGLALRTLYKYLPAEAKKTTGPKGPREEIARRAISDHETIAKEASEKIPYSKGISHSQREGLRSQFTPSQISLMNGLQEKGVLFLAEQLVPVEKYRCPECRTQYSEGNIPLPDDRSKGRPCPNDNVIVEQMRERCDILINTPYGFQATLEVEGEGSSSKGNEEREKLLLNEGIRTVHIPNRMADEYPIEIADMVKVFLEGLRGR